MVGVEFTFSNDNGKIQHCRTDTNLLSCAAGFDTITLALQVRGIRPRAAVRVYRICSGPAQWILRTVSGRERSSTKQTLPCAAGVPGKAMHPVSGPGCVCLRKMPGADAHRAGVHGVMSAGSFGADPCFSGARGDVCGVSTVECHVLRFDFRFIQLQNVPPGMRGKPSGGTAGRVRRDGASLRRAGGAPVL